jgi:hypothetical protein
MEMVTSWERKLILATRFERRSNTMKCLPKADRVLHYEQRENVWCKTELCKVLWSINILSLRL